MVRKENFKFFSYNTNCMEQEINNLQIISHQNTEHFWKIPGQLPTRRPKKF